MNDQKDGPRLVQEPWTESPRRSMPQPPMEMIPALAVDEWIENTARLTGDSIRAAVTHVTAHIMALVVDAEQEVAQLRIDAEDFAKSLTDIGNAHAARIEEALEHLRTTMRSVTNERERIKQITAIKPQPRGG